MKLLPKCREDFVDYLRTIDHFDEAAHQLAILVNDDKPYSEHGRTTHQVIVLVAPVYLQSPLCKFIYVIQVQLIYYLFAALD